MSHRTRSLPEASGLHRLVREIRYHEASRQLIGIVLVGVFSAVGQPSPWTLYAGLPLVGIGVGVRMWAAGCILKNEVLATGGPFAYVRHPLYSGNVLLLAGFAIASGLWWTIVVAVAMLLFFYPTAIDYEDKKLQRIFGEQWLEWSRRTPALLPRPGRRRNSSPTQWSFMQSLRRNGEPIIALYLAGCAYWLATKLG